MKREIDKASIPYSKSVFAEIYEKRYQKGYMDEWPVDKKKRLIEIIKGLILPPRGDVLDFGCGNGVLTNVVRSALPAWNVYGTDLSKTAISNARRRYPKCRFFHPDEREHMDIRFDFVFSNHVFEHVYNLEETFNQMTDFLKPASSMLHILPCGNKGSFERDICMLRKDGIDGKRENRFFFEVKGHLRRLTSDQFHDLAKEKGFHLEKEYYSNQFYGSLEWITSSNMAFVLRFTNSAQAKNPQAKWHLIKWRYFLSSSYLVRNFANQYRKYMVKMNENPLIKIVFSLSIPFFPIAYLVDTWFRIKADQEWRIRKDDPKGSEMILFFRRLG